MIVCAEASAAPATVRSVDECIMGVVCVIVKLRSWWRGKTVESL
jgi:hypothetical protein